MVSGPPKAIQPNKIFYSHLSHAQNSAFDFSSNGNGFAYGQTLTPQVHRDFCLSHRAQFRKLKCKNIKGVLALEITTLRARLCETPPALKELLN